MEGDSMALDVQQQPAGSPAVGASLMISYDELVRIRTFMEVISGKFDVTLALRKDFIALDRRVHKLERGEAYQRGASASRNTILAFLGGAVSMALGGGAVKFLPMLWGGS